MRGIALKSVDSWDAAIGGDADALGQLRGQLLEMEARQGAFVFDIDQTYCGQQGKLTENTIIRGEKRKRPKKSKSNQKNRAAIVPLFRDGLADYPSGIGLPFSVSYFTKDYCKAKKIAFRKQTELAAELIRKLPLPPEARVVVLGDTAFDAEAVRTACEERKFSWIVPINPERVLAGKKPRPRVSSLSESLTAAQMVCLEVHPGEVRRLSTGLPLPDRAEIQAPHVLRARGKSRRSFRGKDTALLFDN